MKKIILLLIMLVLMIHISQAQRSLFTEIAPVATRTMNAEQNRIHEIFRRDLAVRTIAFINVDLNAIREERLTISFRGFNILASRRSTELHENGEGYTWFGSLQDETGIFLTVQNNQVASKFYLGNVPCLIVPFEGSTHLLITYDNSIDMGICGNTVGTPVKSPGKFEPSPDLLSADDNCTMRVIWVVTASAESEIPLNLDLAAQMLQDETNLAYQQSLITLRMEIARVVRTTYVESTTQTSITVYGATSPAFQDLVNLRNGSGLLSTIPTLRNQYNADVVVMVRNQASGVIGGNETFGQAFGVLVDPFTADAANAFAITSTHFMIGGRFTFAHEIGHIQGARHDNHTASPTYGRGNVFTASTAANTRTIMATANVTGCSVVSSGCRIQFFSNPNVSFGGTPTGVVNQRDNARRINETTTQVLANRITSTNLLLPAETFNNEILARHLATQTISTNNNAFIAQSGSRVSMRAGTNITLLPGFHAQNGSTFSAFINTCSFVPTSANMAPPSEVIAIEHLETDTELRVHPNPTTGTLNITHPADVRVLSVVDVMGKVMLVKVNSGATETQLDIGAFAPGIYLLRIDAHRAIRVRKQ